MKKEQFESMIRKNIPDIVSCGSSVEDFEKFGKDYYAVISDLINQMTVTGLKMNLSYTSSKYHTKGRVLSSNKSSNHNLLYKLDL